MAYKGKFPIKNKLKYKGDPDNIIFRSLWERKFMKYCDSCESVLEWASEPIAIPYISPIDKRMHRYFPDFYVKILEADGTIRRSIIEIKPAKQTVAPIKPKRTTKGFIYESIQWSKNQAKWASARVLCEDNGMNFQIFTESDLGIL
jgi:hypothetical protein